MTLKDMIQGIAANDAYDMYMWLLFLSEKKMSCKECVDTHILLNNKLPDCRKCIPSHKLVRRGKNTLEKRRYNNGQNTIKK